MYATVKLLNGWTGRLTYKIPDDWDSPNLIGSLITVPLQKRTEYALIESICNTADTSDYKIREALSYDELVNAARYKSFIDAISKYYALDPVFFYKRLQGFLKTKESSENTIHGAFSEPRLAVEIQLTPEQLNAVAGISKFLDTPSYQACVLHGVTGSGKTEVYSSLINKCFALGKSAVLLLPEVSLAVRFVHFFKQRFQATIPVFGFHSASSVADKKALWNHVRTGQPALIIGVHLPILLPIKQLGIILVDEEHDVNYQEKQYPKINTKEIALLRAKSDNIPIVLGSATPAVATLYNIDKKNWQLYQMTNRFAGAFPTIKVVKFDISKNRSNFWISKELEASLHSCLDKREQAIIFLNRRGYSFFVQCYSCGFTFKCTSCSVSLTYHENEALLCHYCGHQQILAKTCPACSTAKFMKKGIGTQQLVTIIQKLFPAARIARADLDATVDRKKWRQTLEQFSNGDIDILLGTQTITKGYHFPNVTLVGVIWADMHLGLPVYNAAEVTLQQMIQVAGRAGRQHKESKVVIQTMLNHAIFNFLSEVDYLKFFDYEIQQRAMVRYPPFVRFAELELRHEDETIVESESNTCADMLNDINSQKKYAVTILGPAQPPVHKIKRVFIRKIYLKAANMSEITALYTYLKSHPFKSSLLFAPNPLGL